MRQTADALRISWQTVSPANKNLKKIYHIFLKSFLSFCDSFESIWNHFQLRVFKTVYQQSKRVGKRVIFGSKRKEIVAEMQNLWIETDGQDTIWLHTRSSTCSSTMFTHPTTTTIRHWPLPSIEENQIKTFWCRIDSKTGKSRSNRPHSLFCLINSAIERKIKTILRLNQIKFWRQVMEMKEKTAGNGTQSFAFLTKNLNCKLGIFSYSALFASDHARARIRRWAAVKQSTVEWS